MALTRRQLIATTTGTLVLSVLPVKAAHAAEMVDVRMWPAPEYTRVTLEHDEPIKFKYFLVRSPKPYRLVVDIEGLTLTKRLQQMISDVSPNDPFIQSVRIGQYTPEIVRLVMDLKKEVRPEVFSLKPVANYKYRLIFDVYPVGDDAIADVIANLDNRDPLQEVIKKNTASDQPEKPAEPAKTTTSKTNTQNSGAAVTKNSTKPAEKPKTVSKPPIKKRDLVIVVDAGHGGEDSGAVGKYKTREKDVVLQIARRLRSLIEKEGNMKVYMTRNEDIFIPLQVRVAKAQKQRADLFVSIHADAFTSRQPSGSSVFALSTKGATSTAAKYLAQTQNASDLIGGVSKSGDRYVDHTMFDMVQSLTIADSLKFGKAVLNKLGKINKLHKNQVEQAGFAVLKAPDIPSILVETAFISNVEEERKLKTATFQQEVAESILAGIKAYFADGATLARRG